MTNWLPTIKKTGEPLYIEIADAIEAAIQSGELKVGSRLPPLRNVAFDIGVTVGTVSRAYALACERGMVSGEVGRGTYVLGKEKPYLESIPASPEITAGQFESEAQGKVFSFGYSSAADVGQAQTITNTANDIANRMPSNIMDYIRHVPNHWREAGSQWLSSGGWQPSEENIVPTSGAHAAIIAIISSVTSPGDKIVFEGLTYASIARSAALLGRRIVMAAFDEFGIIPEAFEKLCAQQHPKLIYMMPTIQNPTLAKLSKERRIAIAEIAHKFNVYIIEDDIYAPLVIDDCPPMAHFAPDKAFMVGGLAKSVSAGIRAGWVACPPRYANRVANAHKMVTGGSSYWLTELASELVLSGSADQIKQKVIDENIARSAIVRDIMGNHKIAIEDRCSYAWLTLPEPWLAGTFKKTLEKHNIIVCTGDEFKPMRSEQSYHGIRIGYSSTKNKSELIEPLKVIRSLLDSGVAGFDDNNY